MRILWLSRNTSSILSFFSLNFFLSNSLFPQYLESYADVIVHIIREYDYLTCELAGRQSDDIMMTMLISCESNKMILHNII